MTPDMRDFGRGSLKGKHDESLLFVLKIRFKAAREEDPDSYCPNEGTDDDSSVSWINILEIEE